MAKIKTKIKVLEYMKRSIVESINQYENKPKLTNKDKLFLNNILYSDLEKIDYALTVLYSL